jgi:hypothetical protein
MWIGIIAAIILTVIVFSFGANKKTPWHTKENKNIIDDPGSDDGG